VIIDRIQSDVRLVTGDDGITPQFGHKETGLPSTLIAQELSFGVFPSAPSGVAMGWAGSGKKVFYEARK
jgi:hypothetical protein